MNQSIKARWLEALRSGEYEQGFGVLKKVLENGDTYCCLGVLCELAVKDGIIQQAGRSSLDGAVRFTQLDSNTGSSTWLPDVVVEWAGIENETGYNPQVSLNQTRRVPLGMLNDEGTPFTKIADIIEEQL